jgi:ATP-binding cassette subfamily B protein
MARLARLSLLCGLLACSSTLALSLAQEKGRLPGTDIRSALIAAGGLLALGFGLGVLVARHRPGRGSRRRGASVYRRMVRETRPFWMHLAFIFLLSLLASALALLTPVPLKIAVDSVIGSHPLPGFIDGPLPAGATQSDTAVLGVAAGLLLLIAFLSQLQAGSALVLSTYTGQKLLLGFRSKLFSHAQRLSLSYHDLRGTGDSAYRIQYDAPAIQHVAVDGVIPFVTAVFTVGGMVVVTAMIDWQLALVALAVTPLLLLALRTYGSRLRGGWHQAKQLESSALSVVQEALAALRVVKAFGQEERETERFAQESGRSARAQIRLSLLESAFGMLVGLTIGAGTGLVLFIGVRRVQAGALTLGELLLVMGYLAQLYAPLKTISKKAGDLQASFASLDRVFAVLDERPDLVDRPHARPLRRATGGVVFDDVSFAYEEDRPILRDISFAISPGTSIGIAGTTGAGKTTLLSLLTRFYDPTSGRILLDGVDLRDYRLADLRRQFAIVLQEPVLLSNSIGENIAYARPGASGDDLVRAAAAAGAHDFIRRLPDGYDTRVGERGIRLSGGERQRISLARAFLKDAPILILDEPTSSVDLKTEAVIMDAMERLMSGRTTLMIAHRLSTLEACDAHLQIEQGRILDLTTTSAATPPAAPAAPPLTGQGVRTDR